MSDDAAATPPPTEGAAPAKKKPPKGALLVGVLVAALIAGTGSGMFVIGPMLAKKSGYVVAPLPDSAGGEQGEGGGHETTGGGEHGGKEGEGGASASNLHLIDNLVLNPAGSGGTRFLMIAAAVEFKESKMVDAFKARDAEVRDVVLRVIGARTVDELSNMAMRDTLRRIIADSLTLLVPKAERKGAIQRVFFPQFVIQ